MKKLTTHVTLIAVLALLTLTVGFAGWRAQAARGTGIFTELKAGLSAQLSTKLLGRKAAGTNAAATPVKSTAAAFATITVTNTNDSGAGSLRQAIMDSNASVGVFDTIEFNLGAGTPTISPLSQLPDITDPVTINGNTGGSTRVELNGAGAGANVNGLTIMTGNTTIAGLVINRFKSSTNSAFGNGISIPSNGGNTIINCYIGTDATGTIALGNTFDGLRLNMAQNNTIGGITAGERNVISGNGRVGIYIINNVGAAAIGNRVIGNYIGRNATDTADLGNGLSGISIEGAANNTIGGTSAAERNIISGNNNTGVTIFGGASSSGNAILGNSIFNNGSLGIDLALPGGVNPNDAGDGDTGANGLQNYPVTCVTSAGGATTIGGTLNSLATTSFRIEFFVNDACDASGNCEGQTFLGFQNVTTDGSGNATINATFAPAIAADQIITATATRLDAMGNPVETSEFTVSAPTLDISDVTLSEGDAGVMSFVFTVTLTGVQNSILPVTVNYATANGTAIAGSDYTTTSGTLTFAAPHACNSVTQTITVPVTGETMIESNETFFVNLSSPTNATISDAQGLGTINNDDKPPFTASMTDPFVCNGIGSSILVTAQLTNPTATTHAGTFNVTLPASLTLVPNTCTSTIGACTPTPNTQVAWSDNIPAGQSVTIQYQAQIADGTPLGTLITIDSIGTVASVTATVSVSDTVSCPGNNLNNDPVNVALSDQKAGSVLVFPYYTSKASTKADTRLSVSNVGTQQAYLHIFLLDGATCQQADYSVCLTPNGSFTFKASEVDPETTGWALVVAVDAQGNPIQNNALVGNAFLKDGLYVGNYGADAFWANSTSVATLNPNNTATLRFDDTGYDAVPNQFAIEVQSPRDIVGQKIVTVGMNGDLNEAQLTGAGQVSAGLAYNANENPFGSFVGFLTGNCQATAIITPTNPRLPTTMGGIVPSGQAGTLKFKIGGGVGLLLTPQNSTKWSGIRGLHKTSTTFTTITIPLATPIC